MKFKDIPLSKGSIVIILLIMTMVTINLNWHEKYYKGIIESDGKGYYAFLPAIFIYNDLNLGFFNQIENEKYYDEFLQYDYRSIVKGRFISKYCIGYCKKLNLICPAIRIYV